MTEASTTTMMGLMHQGGWVMWALLAFSIVSLGTAVERALALHRAGTDLGPLLSRLREALLRKRSLKDALAICGEARGAAARVAEKALHRFDGSVGRLEKALERHGLSEIRRLSRGLGILATVATVAPLLGFLGTVTGMMASFEALWLHGTGNPQMVALGISEALTTTAAGLAVAVPTQIVHNALAARADRITVDVEAVANFLLEVREELGAKLA